MKRKLNDKERTITEKNLSRHIENIEELRNSLEYNKDLIKKQNEQREFDDKWRTYLRSRKDKEDQKVIDMISREIEETQFTIDKAQQELNEGTDLPEMLNG